MTILRIFDNREPHPNDLPSDHPFVIAMTQALSERTKAELKAIDDNIRAAWVEAGRLFIGSPPPKRI